MATKRGHAPKEDAIIRPLAITALRDVAVHAYQNTQQLMTQNDSQSGWLPHPLMHS
jgi:hypothetical protein